MEGRFCDDLFEFIRSYLDLFFVFGKWADSYLRDMVIKPLRAQLAVDIVEITVIISSHVLQHAEHSPRIDEGEQRADEAFMDQIR